ncbi:MAG: extensin, partial [Burkholderia vietnamiensis]|nr:extensin [Burkholderia vietnamiensis]
AQPAQRAETPETAALVRESAKLDPSLPPPQYVATPGLAQPHAAAGSNPVAAAMTEQLVRQSSTIRTTPASTNGAPVAP